jgi:hypothetical protein
MLVLNVIPLTAVPKILLRLPANAQSYIEPMVSPKSNNLLYLGKY